MASGSKPHATFRDGEPLRIGHERVFFGRNTVIQAGSGFVLQHRLFVNDPWEIIAEGIHRALPANRNRDIAHSFRRQAEDYFRAATTGRHLAVQPVLLYYAFLNLSKAYALVKGNTRLSGRSYHGVSSVARPNAIPGSLIKFDTSSVARPGVFQELLQHLDGNPVVLASDLRIGRLLPQILPGHRLWCYAAKKPERFIPVEDFQVLHLGHPDRLAWLNVFLNKNDLDQLGISDEAMLRQASLSEDFEIVGGAGSGDTICLQQKVPESYSGDPGDALVRITRKNKNRIWETAKIVSPYRKSYIYCCPSAERKSRLPQLLSVYLLMFFLSSVTRYSPLYFEDLLNSKYGPLFETFISESPMQFLYLMASEILGREVSKAAII